MTEQVSFSNVNVSEISENTMKIAEYKNRISLAMQEINRNEALIKDYQSQADQLFAQMNSNTMAGSETPPSVYNKYSDLNNKIAQLKGEIFRRKQEADTYTGNIRRLEAMNTNDARTGTGINMFNMSERT